MLEIGGGRRPALIFVNDLRLRGTLLPSLALGLGAVIAAYAFIIDSGEGLLLGLLIAALAVLVLLWLLAAWIARRFSRDRIYFALVRDGVVIGSLLGQKFIAWELIDSWRVVRGEFALIDLTGRETYLELIGRPDGSPERSIARNLMQRTAARVDALSAERPELADALAKSLEGFAESSGTVTSADGGTRGVVQRLSGARQRTRVQVDRLSAPADVVIETFRKYWDDPQQRRAIGGSIGPTG